MTYASYVALFQVEGACYELNIFDANDPLALARLTYVWPANAQDPDSALSKLHLALDKVKEFAAMESAIRLRTLKQHPVKKVDPE